MRIATLFLGLCLTGCAGIEYAQQNYSGVELVEHTNTDDTFRIFDKPAEGRLMITPSMGTIMATSAVEGATFQAASPLVAVPKPVFQKAAAEYLQSTGRSCTIKDGHLIAKPQWEFRYQCA